MFFYLQLDQLQAMKLDHESHIVDLSTVWFDAQKNTETNEKVLGLRLTPSGDYKTNYLTTEAFMSSPTHQSFGDSYFRYTFPKENMSHLDFFNCSERFALCREAEYFKLTFRFYINLENAVEKSVQQINIRYSNVSINEPCVDPVTGLEEKCNGHGLCVPYIPDFSSQCFCHSGFTGKQCEHASPTTVHQSSQQTSKATTPKIV